ncbi:MAG: hypothetical protein JXX14_02425 [Deltaproteobacteria bacterium]|nr:hypothetical protein [Deltaproteobacteria bacterium]
MKHYHLLTTILLLLTCAVLVWLPACNEDESGDAPSSETCTPVLPKGTMELGQPCQEIDDCASGFCSVTSHTPTDPNGVCQAAPPPGDVHLLANVRDFMTDELLPGATVKIGGALDISQNPTGFPATDTLIADDAGYIDTVLTGPSVKVAMGIMAVVEYDGYYTTVTGLVKPEAGCGVYPAGTRNPNLITIKQSDLTLLSDILLADFPALADVLPLGDKGGVLGNIRDVVTGDMVSGITLRSTRDTSVAQIFYLNETKDGFVETMSSSSGIFVIIGAGLAEEFDAWYGESIVSRRPATIGETVGILLTTTFQIEM